MASDEDVLAMDRAATLIAQGIRLRERSRSMARAAANKLAAANKILKGLEEKKPKLNVIK